MDVAAYGLSRNPFERNSDLDEACLPNPLAALLSELQASLRSPQGVSVLIGERGCGKSLLARIFARRLAGHARAALSTAPGPTLADVLAEVLAQLGGDDVETRDEGRLLHELGILAQRRARAGSTTAIVLDDAQRLSPQVLGGLSRLFPEDSEEAPQLHLFLIGRPELLDRMNASADRLLLEHLLQICRVEPLGLRDSVRYLERRLASCGGEMLQLFEPEAIDEIVARANGRLLALESLTEGAFENATRCGAQRVTTEHVEKAPHVAHREEEPMAPRQQPLRFEFQDESSDEEALSDGSAAWDESDVEGEDDTWTAGDEDDEEASLSWDTAAQESDLDEEIDDDIDDTLEAEARGESASATARAAKVAAAAAIPRRGLAAMAVLTASVFTVLVWAANRVPSDPATQSGGRDALLFAEPLTSKPREILRLAETAEQADPAAQVAAWNSAMAAAAGEDEAEPDEAELDRPAKPAPIAAGPATEEPYRRPAPVVEAKASPQPAKNDAVRAGTAVARPQTKPIVVASRSTPPDSARASKAAGPSPRDAATKAARSASVPRVAGRSASTSVYTVQVGAFRTRRNAEDLISKMGPRLHTARIVNEGGLYRVVSGSFESKGAAAAHGTSLQRAGLTTYVRSATF